MKKITAILVAALLMGGLAPSVMGSEDNPDERTFDADHAKALIMYEGFSVDRVERWGEYVRAFLSDGTMAYFDPDTLRPVLLPY
ncbi:MAG TPA: hypothetical protein VLZ53_08185 [Devosia sp.]|jgi:hypothetical protein|nr:hypothetical protein [Devosia sp.]